MIYVKKANSRPRFNKKFGSLQERRLFLKKLSRVILSLSPFVVPLNSFDTSHPSLRNHKGVFYFARKQRIWFPGAKYHITSRGIRKSTLFFDDDDRMKYLNLLNETMNTNPFFLHSYCLMSTHIHLQLETITIPPGLIMKHLHTAYAKYFNNKYSFTGHVFEGRYGAQLIDTSEYELDVSKYIHLNPVKAKLVDRPEDYKWSSFRDYLTSRKSSLLHTAHILSYFPKPDIENYYKYVNSPFVIMNNSTSLYTEFYGELLKS